MIASISGKVLRHFGSKIVVEAGGVGYGIAVSASDQSTLPVGTSTLLYIYEHIREDAHDLYGFRRETDQVLFEQLLTAKGVGPKGAMSIISSASQEDIRRAIASGDTAFIARAPGVGKRVAERIVVDLKDKVGLLPSADAVQFLTNAPVNDEAVEALVALGYSEQDAVKALQGIDQALPTGERVRKALGGK
jgi:holliday junction DNA helicase RuvA